VKLLFDENLSRRLVPRIVDLFPDSKHVNSEGLLQADDSQVWAFAKANDFAIVSADADFYEMATTIGSPPKVIWLRNCDYPTEVCEECGYSNHYGDDGGENHRGHSEVSKTEHDAHNLRCKEDPAERSNSGTVRAGQLPEMPAQKCRQDQRYSAR
jgi:predicted nuclease of predicted toxin-antitoxin system